MKVTATANGVTLTELPGYEGYEFVFGFSTGAARPSGFFVHAPDGTPLTATAIRRLPLDRLLKAAAEARAEETRARVEPSAAGRPYGGGEEHAAQVAEVYRWAVEHGMPPRRAIATRWARSEATAGRWIAEARRKGLIPARER
ncbi:hypothetical protein ACQKM2_24750 [Streptomyces sp. NPDC004126]|uniref:hypothetical protein n=1 Tax=Streptomyces sp. NPDC004126 TaxID=3390695 RepID=UPI003D01C797